MINLDSTKWNHLAFVIAVLCYLLSKLVASLSRRRTRTYDVLVSPSPSRVESQDAVLIGKRILRLKLVYLPAYLLATCGDWMTGAYIYAVYEGYGYTIGDIGLLFIVGYGSSMVLGPSLGTMTDRYGRKKGCMAYCIAMALSCACVYSRNFNVLALGRFFGGVGTSLLYSAFESWCVGAHGSAGLPTHSLAEIFSLATFMNALTAIFAGFLSNALATRYGEVAPFGVAVGFLCLCFVLIHTTWEENYGATEPALSIEGRKQAESGGGGVMAAVRFLLGDSIILRIGLISILFESSMFMFVFLWTPALQHRFASPHGLEDNGGAPLGYIFAIFMVWKMVGTVVFDMFSYSSTQRLLALALLLSGFCFVIPGVFVSSYGWMILSFCLYEMCIGIYWPSISSLRSEKIREEVRATSINVMRIPLNAIVMLILLFVEKMDEKYILLCCAANLFVAFFLTMSLIVVGLDPKIGHPNSNVRSFIVSESTPLLDGSAS